MNTEYPTSRKLALAAGVKKYFTGEPCRHGHIAYRYAQSGACSECIGVAGESKAAAPGENDAANPPPKVKQSARAAALEQLVTVAVRSTPETVSAIRNLASGLVTMRFPELNRADAWSPKAGTDYQAGRCQYKFNIHPDDIQFIRDQAQLHANGGRKVDINAERLKIFAEAIAPWKGENDEPPFVP